MSDEPMSQRDKRRQEFEANKPKVNFNAGALKKWAWPMALVLVVGGVIALMVATNSAAGNCPGHWHNAYSVWIDGERVEFDNGEFADANNVYAPGTHIHADDGVYHWHPAVEKCVPLEDGLKNLGVEVDSDSLELSSQHGTQAGTYDDAPVRVFRQSWSVQDDQWAEMSSLKFMGKQIANGDGIVILYGTYTDAEVEAILAQAPSMKGNQSYDPHFTPAA